MTSDNTGPEPVETGERPLLVCLHWLGGSARAWDHLAASVVPFVDVMALDLPGFGAECNRGECDVAGMAAFVIERIRHVAPRRWMLAGHSMGAKVALAVARAAEDGGDGLGGLSGIVLLAGSPPAPEPMDETRRAAMLDWFAGGLAESRRQAQTFIDSNVAASLASDRNAAVVGDILRLNRSAWVGWLERGSREDWVARIGTLATPALIVAGEQDGDLGPDGQKRLMLPHFAAATFHMVPDAGHLLPVERPDIIADLILRHAGLPGLAAAGAAFRAILGSDRVSARTREALVSRASGDDPAEPPRAVAPHQMAALRALADRVVPQEPGSAFDIAARIDRDLATQPGDGWRFSDLPPDIEAYRRAIDTLQGEAEARYAQPFETLPAGRQDALVSRIAEGHLEGHGPFTADQMRLWFQDFAANVVRTYVSHPATMARLGYGGFAYGGDGGRLQGFSAVGIDRTEPWEPTPIEGSAP